MWFDDLRVYQTGEDPVEPEPELPNLLNNGDFETGEYSTDYKTTLTGAGLQVVTDVKHGGAYSLHATGAEKFKFFRQAFTVKPNTDYTMEMWVKAEKQEGAYPGYVQITDGAGSPLSPDNKVKFDLNPDGTWKKVSIAFHSADYTAMSVKVTVEGYKMWFDDLRVYQTGA